MRQSNLQRKNEAALTSRRIQAVEHRCAARLAGAHPSLKDRSLLNYTRIENVHRVRNQCFVMYRRLGNLFFLFPC